MTTPSNHALMGLAGGAPIGVASAIYLATHGRIAGISGIVAGALERAADWRARASFHRFVLRRPAPRFDSKFHLPTRGDVDARLVLGAAIFGVGWGLGGYCPGPGLASLASGAIGPIVFVAAMVAGMRVQRSVDIALARHDPGRSAPTQIAIESVWRSS